MPLPSPGKTGWAGVMVGSRPLEDMEASTRFDDEWGGEEVTVVQYSDRERRGAKLEPDWPEKRMCTAPRNARETKRAMSQTQLNS